MDDRARLRRQGSARSLTRALIEGVLDAASCSTVAIQTAPAAATVYILIIVTVTVTVYYN